MLPHALMSLKFCVDWLFSRIFYFKPCLARPLLKRSNNSITFKKLIFTYSCKLLGELTVIWKLILNFRNSIRNSAGADIIMPAKLTLTFTQNFGLITSTE